LSFAAEGADRMKKLETVICEEDQLIRDTARLISLHELLSEHVIDGRRFIPKSVSLSWMNRIVLLRADKTDSNTITYPLSIF